MKKIYKYIIQLFVLPIIFLSCNKDENIVFDSPFISIEALNAASAGPVNTDQEFVGEYMIYLNSPAQSQKIDVTYEIIVGNGLVNGRDYQILTEGTVQNFLPGIYDMPIRIKWLRTCERDADGNIINDPLDDTKDTTLKIKLIKSNTDFTLGYPGPDQLKKEIVIKKEKAK